MDSFTPLRNYTVLPTIHVISDSVGLTAKAIARAAAAQFGVSEPCIEVLSKVKTASQIASFLDAHAAHHLEATGKNDLIVFYTLVDRKLCQAMREYAATHDNIHAVDVLTPAIEVIEAQSGMCPSYVAGAQHIADSSYFKRVEAVEFTIAHDDGRNPQDLPQAEIVLAGVSRTSKTPLSIYLSQQGYKVANVPLDPQTEPPKELFEVDRRRLFGLMTTVEVLTEIRKKRLGKVGSAVAGRYANPEYIYEDLESARALMRKLGCIVIHTEHRAVEETAQEILRYYERSFPESGTGHLL